MTRTTVNICYQKSGNDYLVYKGLCPYPFGKIYCLLFINLLNDEQRKYVENNKHSISFTTNILRLSIEQFFYLVQSVSPNYKEISHYESVYVTAKKLKNKMAIQ